MALSMVIKNSCEKSRKIDVGVKACEKAYSIKYTSTKPLVL